MNPKAIISGLVILSSILSLIVLLATGIIYLVANEGKIKSKEGFTYRVYVIEKCEYLNYNGGFSHKGNCTNIFHKK